MSRRGQKSRARRKAREVYSVANLRVRAFHNQGGKCYWCGQAMTLYGSITDPLVATADHLDPTFAGGKTKPGNIVASCGPCNHSRHGPDTNHSKKDTPSTQIGEDVAHSPFSVLRDFFKRS